MANKLLLPVTVSDAPPDIDIVPVELIETTPLLIVLLFSRIRYPPLLTRIPPPPPEIDSPCASSSP